MTSGTPTDERSGGADGVPDAPGAGRVVVGVDGSPGAFAALVWTLAAAARSGAEVEVVSTFPVGAYWTDPYRADAGRTDTARSDTEARTRAFLAEAMGEPTVTAVPRAAAVRVHVTVGAGTPAEYLVRRAEGARLLVVGSRGRGGVRSTLLGSVALHCAVHAPCPVMVVRPQPARAPAAPRAAAAPASP